MASSSTSNSESTAIPQVIAAELNLPLRQVLAAVELLDAGNTTPFIARYRKEATQGLDEIALRAIEDATIRAMAESTAESSGEALMAVVSHWRSTVPSRPIWY